MYNIRIISVNVEDEEIYKDVQNFGHQIENGKKIRYLIRRNLINKFIEENKYLDLKIENAVTPCKFTIIDNNCIHNNKYYTIYENSIFYICNNLSHYNIWNIEEDTLILEDDIVLSKNIFDDLGFILNEFKKINIKNKLLYLQRSIPWSPNFEDKTISYNEIGNSFIREISSFDYSGTGAYFLTKECKKILLDNLIGLRATDKYLEFLRQKGIIRFFIPKNNDLMFRLDKNTTWL